MLSKKLYINIILRVLLITAISVLLGYSFFSKQSIRLTVIFAVIIIILTINLILFLNRTNRNIRFFFDSVRNDDSNLFFPVDHKSGSLKELHQSMNAVNRQIQNLKIENNKQEQFFRRILELLATGIITYDNKGFIHHSNSAAKKLFSIDTLTHLGQIERIHKNLYEAIKNLKPSERQLVAINTSQGDIQLLLKSTTSGTGKDELCILSIQDIKRELDEKEVDAWMKLIRVLMHEIMNSITPITSLSDSLLKIYMAGDGQIKPEEVSEKTIYSTIKGLDVISQQGKGLMNFVESYRKLARIPKPDLKLLSVTLLFSRVNMLIETLEKRNNTKVTFQMVSPDIEILADENLISQVLINLIKNALEANEENSSCKISISAGIGPTGNPEICVNDNGPGIGEDILEEIFIPFYTTREKGSGIGLSISRQIMGIHGGSLTVKSKPGSDTLFCMRFRK
jgi:nitrogen fixation/metabolism regulation signal transduction histidine kinase